MSRLTHKQYERRAMLAMTVYVACMLGVWPLLRDTGSLPLQMLLALAPVMPMLYLIALMARRIRDSDELEQRTHLLALGAATAVVGALSMIGGFLAAAGVLRLDGSILIWVFPVLMAGYGATRWWVARRYGVSLSCDEKSGMPLYLRFVAMAVALGAVAWWFRRSLDSGGVGTLCGMAAGFAVMGALLGINRWRASRHPTRAEP